MKKIVCFLLAICFAFPAVACGRPAGQEPDDGTDQSQQQGQTDDGGTEQGGSGEEPSPAEETLKLSARMFDNARVNLNDADSIGLIAEEGLGEFGITTSLRKKELTATIPMWNHSGIRV